MVLGLLYFFHSLSHGSPGSTHFIHLRVGSHHRGIDLSSRVHTSGSPRQLAAVHREPHPEACVQFVSLELAGIFPCQCESSHHALDICWVLCFFIGFVLCFLCFVEQEIVLRVTQRPHKRSATVYNNHALQPHSVPSPLIFFFPFSFF